MTKSSISLTLQFIVLVIAQAIVFNHVCLFGVAVPLVFIYFLLHLPMTMGSISVMTLGFFLGLTVDIFSDTAGMNALACTIASALRLPVLHLYLPREEDISNPVPSMRSLGIGVYLKYTLTFTLLYCTLFFTIESFTFFNITKLVARILGSTTITFILIICIDALRRTNK